MYVTREEEWEDLVFYVWCIRPRLALKYPPIHPSNTQNSRDLQDLGRSMLIQLWKDHCRRSGKDKTTQKKLMDVIKSSTRCDESMDSDGNKELQNGLETVLNGLRNYTPYSVPFLNKINRREVPDYYTIVQTPMDLGTMMSKLKKGEYPSREGFEADLKLIYDNCYLYNEEGSIYREYVSKLMDKAKDLFHSVFGQEDSKNGESTQSQSWKDVVRRDICEQTIPMFSEIFGTDVDASRLDVGGGNDAFWERVMNKTNLWRLRQIQIRSESLREALNMDPHVDEVLKGSCQDGRDVKDGGDVSTMEVLVDGHGWNVHVSEEYREEENDSKDVVDIDVLERKCVDVEKDPVWRTIVNHHRIHKFGCLDENVGSRRMDVVKKMYGDLVYGKSETNCAVSRETARTCMVKCVGMILLYVGFEGTIRTSLSVLSDVCSKFLENVCRAMKTIYHLDRYRDECGRVRDALFGTVEESGTSFRELKEFLNWSQYKYPARVERHCRHLYEKRNEMDDDDEEGLRDVGFLTGNFAEDDDLGLDMLGLKELGLSHVRVPDRLIRGEKTRMEGTDQGYFERPRDRPVSEYTDPISLLRNVFRRE